MHSVSHQTERSEVSRTSPDHLAGFDFCCLKSRSALVKQLATLSFTDTQNLVLIGGPEHFKTHCNSDSGGVWHCCPEWQVRFCSTVDLDSVCWARRRDGRGWAHRVVAGVWIWSLVNEYHHS
jgi:hypothetical protein